MLYDSLMEALRGVAFTTPTPFDADGDSILHDRLREHVTWLAEAGANLFIPCGNTGEYYSLSNDERIAVLETVVDAVGDSRAVIGGVGGSTKTAIELAGAYADVGADGIMIMQPVHTHQHEVGLLHYYQEIVDATDLGVVVYNSDPAVTPSILRNLAGYDHVVGVKYAINDVARFARAVDAVDVEVVWSNGIAERFAPAFALEGAAGYTTGIGSFLPAETLALMDALRNEDWGRALAIRDLLRPYEDLREEPGRHNTLRAANNVPAVKFGMELAGLYGGPVREPIVDLSAEGRRRARRYYETITSSNVVRTETAAE